MERICPPGHLQCRLWPGLLHCHDIGLNGLSYDTKHYMIVVFMYLKPLRTIIWYYDDLTYLILRNSCLFLWFLFEQCKVPFRDRPTSSSQSRRTWLCLSICSWKFFFVQRTCRLTDICHVMRDIFPTFHLSQISMNNRPIPTHWVTTGSICVD